MADSAAQEAGVKAQDDAIATAAATVDKSKSELAKAKMLLDRADLLQQHQLIAKQDYDTRVADYRSAQAALREDEARLAQVKSQRAQDLAQLTSYQRRVAQSEAGLARIADVLAKFDAVSPIDGVVTNLPVREGETVVPGVQNSAASTIMTIADMSLITAEVKVDETDIVNVQLGQQVAVKIDAMPDKTFAGKVIEIGNTAILRSSGLAASQSTTSSQEAKDFKVVVALTDPPSEIRPGLSCNAKITTATRQERVDHSDSGVDGSHQGRSGASQDRRAGGRDRAQRQIAQRRSAGRVRGPQREGRVPQGGDGHHRSHRHRGD